MGSEEAFRKWCERHKQPGGITLSAAGLVRKAYRDGYVAGCVECHQIAEREYKLCLKRIGHGMVAASRIGGQIRALIDAEERPGGSGEER